MVKEKEEQYVTLVNPAGEEEQVWDFADHIERLLKMGFTYPASHQKSTKQAITTKEKETL